MDVVDSKAGASTAAPEIYPRFIRVLHWLMAAGFVFMWASGVVVTNAEGRDWWIEGDRQGVLRDLHKSVGLTLLALLVVRIVGRAVLETPSWPERLRAPERRAARAGHLAIYAVVVLASLTGLAIADLQRFGNAWFGVPLPPIVPERQAVLGWSVDPWSYVLHAVFAYGLLALVLGHALFVRLHRRDGVDLGPRIAGRAAPRLIGAATVVLVSTAVLVGSFAVRAWVTVGPQETPRDYVTTTPFAR